MLSKIKERTAKISIIGLGYVGLPLIVEFAKAGFKVVGYDINSQRIEQLKEGFDRTNEVPKDLLGNANILYTNEEADLKGSDFFIIAVPTPVDSHNVPDLNPIISSAAAVGRNMSKGSIIILESTVYPGVSEEVMLPELERVSGLSYPSDFKIGYSPERVNPGDKEHTLVNTTKIVSGCDEPTAQIVDEIYRTIVNETFLAKNIKTAEAAKVIENTQRDLNIALMNELAVLFDKQGISVWDVIEAAGTKWNFLKFTPGLVGGHCIPVDPYYLVYKAEVLGYHPQIIAAGRRINDGITKYVCEKIIKKLSNSGKRISGSKGLILGVTFKENVVDIRNSRTSFLINDLKSYGMNLSAHDPWVEKERMADRFNVDEVLDSPEGKFDFIVVSVPHKQFENLDFGSLLLPNGFVFDVKNSSVPKKQLEENGFTVLSL